VGYLQRLFLTGTCDPGTPPVYSADTLSVYKRTEEVYRQKNISEKDSLYIVFKTNPS
jgi:hypothetical protein